MLYISEKTMDEHLKNFSFDFKTINFYFKTIKNKKNNKYDIYTREGKLIVKDVDSFETLDVFPEYIITVKNQKKTLFFKNGQPEEYAQNVDNISFKNSGSVWSSYDVTTRGQTVNYPTRENLKRRLPALTISVLPPVLIYILGSLIYYMKQEKLNETPATYLGQNSVYTLFDTDGDESTVEVTARRDYFNPKASVYFYNLGKKGKTHLISEWKKAGFYNFEFLKKDNQKTR